MSPDQRRFENSGLRSAIRAAKLRDLRELIRNRLVLVGARQVAHDRGIQFPVAKNLENWKIPSCSRRSRFRISRSSKN